MPLIGHLLLNLIDKICVIVVVAYLITRTKYFSEVLDGTFTIKNQAILVLIFGAFSVFGTISGVEIFGVIANFRDIGPMIGGLIGGPLIGLGAGLIGGGYRYLLGGFTDVPCSVATIMAGLVGGLIYILNGHKFVGAKITVIFSILMEIFHTVLVILLADPFTEVVIVVQEIGVPMILSNSFGMLIFAIMISNLINERETAQERDSYFDELERKKYELKIARDIQQSFLPESVPLLEGFDIAAASRFAKEVGGDFYDFIPLSTGKIGFVIGDVSGKGVPAALFMVLSRAAIRANATGNTLASEVIKNANNLIFADAKSGMFVTLFYAVLDLKMRTLTYVNAGHNPPFFLYGATGELNHLKTKGIAMGVIDDFDFEEKTIALREGDLIVFYTDGVTEAVDERYELFGTDRLIKIARERAHLSAADLIEEIEDEVFSFCKDELQFDDITLMVLKVENKR